MCRHVHKTLVQHISDVGWYSAYQCDMCGYVTQDAVPVESYDDTGLPNIDLAAYSYEIKRRVQKLAQMIKEVR